MRYFACICVLCDLQLHPNSMLVNINTPRLRSCHWRNHAMKAPYLAFTVLAAISFAILGPAGAMAGTTSAKSKPDKSQPAKTKPDHSEMETYQGHLVQGDQGFTLQLNHYNTASLAWTDDTGMTVNFIGTYTGENGNYIVKLTPNNPPRNSRTTPFTLFMQGIGGEETAAFSPNKSTARLKVPSIKLMEVDGGNIKLHPPKQGSKTHTKSKKHRTTHKKRVVRHFDPGIHYVY